MSEHVSYLNDEAPETYAKGEVWETDGRRCSYEYQHGSLGDLCCGLPAWTGASDEEPRCVFHSPDNPDDLGPLLGQAVEDGVHLPEAKLLNEEFSYLDLSEANFWVADFSGSFIFFVDLSGANLSRATFVGTSMSETVDLSGADLSYADLTNAVLSNTTMCGANLTGAALSCADLSGADLSGADLSDADLSGADLSDANLAGAKLNGARMDVVWIANEAASDVTVRRSCVVRGTDLRAADLDGAVIVPECDLEGALFGLEADGPPGDDIIGDHPDVYRQLKLAYQESGDYFRAGEFFLREMKALRHGMQRRRKEILDEHTPEGAGPVARMIARTKCDFSSRSGAAALWRQERTWWLFEKVCGYGEKPSSVALLGVIGIVLFALAFRLCGVPGVDSIGSAFYLSIVTFTTLGFGDITPIDTTGRLLAGTEAMFGLLAASLFMVCLVRKFTR